MGIEHWRIIVGTVVSMAIAGLPWVLMVHSKLAVIASQMLTLSEKLDRSVEANQRLWEIVARHEARLDTHNVQIAHFSQRLEEC